jgi:hypothetical protein
VSVCFVCSECDVWACICVVLKAMGAWPKKLSDRTGSRKACEGKDKKQDAAGQNKVAAAASTAASPAASTPSTAASATSDAQLDEEGKEWTRRIVLADEHIRVHATATREVMAHVAQCSHLTANAKEFFLAALRQVSRVCRPCGTQRTVQCGLGFADCVSDCVLCCVVCGGPLHQIADKESRASQGTGKYNVPVGTQQKKGASDHLQVMQLLNSSKWWRELKRRKHEAEVVLAHRLRKLN